MASYPGGWANTDFWEWPLVSEITFRAARARGGVLWSGDAAFLGALATLKGLGGSGVNEAVFFSRYDSLYRITSSGRVLMVSH